MFIFIHCNNVGLQFVDVYHSVSFAPSEALIKSESLRDDGVPTGMTEFRFGQYFSLSESEFQHPGVSLQAKRTSNSSDD
ncbi:MAG: hypothetical protein WCK78_09080 [Paludibacter sp.]